MKNMVAATALCAGLALGLSACDVPRDAYGVCVDGQTRRVDDSRCNNDHGGAIKDGDTRMRWTWFSGSVDTYPALGDAVLGSSRNPAPNATLNIGVDPHGGWPRSALRSTYEIAGYRR